MRVIDGWQFYLRAEDAISDLSEAAGGSGEAATGSPVFAACSWSMPRSLEDKLCISRRSMLAGSLRTCTSKPAVACGGAWCPET